LIHSLTLSDIRCLLHFFTRSLLCSETERTRRQDHPQNDWQRIRKGEGESWGKFSYAEYFENLRRARWVIALDASLSAGQVIAEASLLGTPTIAFAAKPNARLLLPDDLVIAHDSSAEGIITFTMDVIDSYDSGMKSYDNLSALVRERATDRLTRVDVHDLELKFKSCCDSSW